MTNIDWNKQNPNYPLWLEGKGEHAKHSGWYRRVGEVFEHETHGQFRAVRECQFFDVHSKPEWSGEGLPPVGTVCEYTGHKHGLNPGAHVEIIHHFHAGSADVAAFIYSQGVGMGRHVAQAVADKFRPIRTPEQIASEEEEKAIEEMAEDLRSGFANPKIAARNLYKAGYRKQVAE